MFHTGLTGGVYWGADSHTAIRAPPSIVAEGGGWVWMEIQKWEVVGISSDDFTVLCEVRRKVIPERI